MADTQTPAIELLLTRTFDAPRDLVFKVWTQAEHLAHWWGPKGMELKIATCDVKPGGIFHYAMVMANGQEMWGKFEYQVIQAPDRLEFVSGFADAEGNFAPNPWAPVWPLRILNVVTFAEENGKTTISMAGAPVNATVAEIAAYREARPNMQQGFKGTFEQLDAYLASIKE